MTRIRRHHRGWPVARALQVEAIARAKAGREAGGSSGQPDEASVAEPGARRGRGRGSLAGPVESPPRPPAEGAWVFVQVQREATEGRLCKK